jgi:hypothetical protein
MHCYLSLRFLAVAFIVLLFTGCTDDYEYSNDNFALDALNLRDAAKYWASTGKPNINNIEDYLKPRSDFFIFTNTISYSNQIFHCCFAVRRSGRPDGFLTVSDQGVVIWIREHDTNITISPEKYGVKK